MGICLIDYGHFCHFICYPFSISFLASFTDLHHVPLFYSTSKQKLGSFLSSQGYCCNVKIAIKMYQVAGEEMFMFWTVCKIQLQVMSSVTTLIFFISFAPPPET
ncbi:hypothetical protein H5410_037465 [Solanum commersonii]|uniref:Uncharacterized protein n=1 Tax=Solanum commersonii TaxID=4109 RepID=A0A9J5Y782_SOLCO|nr:hypothetical protein H5410_037465 [Solanum commersonii]